MAAMLFYHPAAAYQRMCGYDLAPGATGEYGTLKEEQNRDVISTRFHLKVYYRISFIVILTESSIVFYSTLLNELSILRHSKNVPFGGN